MNFTETLLFIMFVLCLDIAVIVHYLKHLAQTSLLVFHVNKNMSIFCGLNKENTAFDLTFI